jgi:hypothetical protein
LLKENKMAIFTTADGRQIVGAAQAGNEYKGYAGRREIVIQLTATGATQDSLDALEFLKSYAVYHNSVGEPIFPASTNVFISNNGVTKAVEADEVTVDGANVSIGGCVWNGTAWDFTNAGQSGGGGSSGGGVLVVNVILEGEEDATMDKTWQEIYDAPFSVARVQTGQTSVMLCQIYAIRQQDSEYSVSVILPTAAGASVNFADMKFSAVSANDYPTMGK